MPLHIDHISLASPHIFRSADALAKETGLGYWTGEWLRETSVNIVPLGPPGNFIEISGFIDIFTLREMNERRQWLLDITETGDHFNGLCLGVDSMEELEVFAKYWKSEINRADNPDPSAHFQRANGYILPMASTPVTKRSVWMLGLPNVYYYPDRTRHSSGQPTHAIPNQVRPTGIEWVEVGGTAQQMADWLGGMQYVDMLPLKFNGKSLGVWAVSVGAEGRDDIVIRRPAASDAVPVSRYADTAAQ
jgi:hypothetical protein